MTNLMRYIPKEYKNEVDNIYLGDREYNEVTKRWSNLIVVEWKDGEQSIYASAEFMRNKLKEFGRE